MTRKEIEVLNGAVITREEFEEIEEHEEVTMIENHGYSGIIPGSTWYTVYFSDGKEIYIYFKPEKED